MKGDKMDTPKKNRLISTRYIALGFLITIILGTFLLNLPISHRGQLKGFDALFVATSATCVTGLSTVTVVDTFTPFGQFIIMCLIQIGGLRLYACNCTCFDDSWETDNIKG